jgi:hypothetical protein
MPLASRFSLYLPDRTAALDYFGVRTYDSN